MCNTDSSFAHEPNTCVIKGLALVNLGFIDLLSCSYHPPTTSRRRILGCPRTSKSWDRTIWACTEVLNFELLIPALQIMFQFSFITADPTWSEIFEKLFPSASSKFEGLFSLKQGKKDVRTLSCDHAKVGNTPKKYFRLGKALRTVFVLWVKGRTHERVLQFDSELVLCIR